MRRVRCRLGLHRRVRVRVEDGELATPQARAAWTTRCRDCGRIRGAGGVGSVILFAAAIAVALALFFTTSPFLGAIVMVGTVLGLGWAMGPAAIARIARWLSFDRQPTLTTTRCTSLFA
jgi:hypothetical protein